jgi:cell division protease FtsH
MPKSQGSGNPADRPPDNRNQFSWPGLVILAVMLLGMWWWRSSIERSAEPTLDYSIFYHLAQDGKVESVTLRGQDVNGKLKGNQVIDGRTIGSFRSMLPKQDEQTLPMLRDKNVRIKVESEEAPFAVEFLLSLLPWALIIGVWIFISRRAQKMMAGGGPLGNLLKPRTRRFEKTAQVNITFDDVAGLIAAKRDLQEIVEFLKRPEYFRRLGGKVPRGVLLVGPPGTGKTLLARAAAGESGVPFYSISGSEFIEMFVGLGAARVRELFDEAKKSGPAIIFIDEIDAVGRLRGTGYGGGNDEREQTLNQLLSEMDGFSRSDSIIVIAATNRPDVLDPALLRPGRFDRRVVVDRPELAARRAILEVHVKGKPLASDVDLDDFARNTPGFSGADLENLVNEAVLNATRRGADAIFAVDFRQAYDKIVLGELREAKLDAEEKQRVAVHESGHAVVAYHSPHTEPLRRVTIIPRGMALGVTQQTPLNDRHIATQLELESQLSALMGGYVAEKMVLGQVSTGAENDLREATRTASKMVARYGMSEKLGAVYYDYEVEHPFLGQRIATESGASQATLSAVETEARAALGKARKRAEALIAAHRDGLDRLVAVLLDSESVERDEIGSILGPADHAQREPEKIPA